MKKTTKLFFIGIFFLIYANAFSQITIPSNAATGSPEFVGWDNTGTSKQLNIKNNSAVINPIDFYIQNTMFLQILTSGDLRIVNGTNGYKINNDFVLRHNNNTSDIFVGVNAGNNSMSGHSNTLVGNGAGVAITTSAGNVAIGASAATALTSGEHNTAVGESAATSITTGEHNTAVGYDALESAVNLHWNTAVGYEALSQGATCPLCINLGQSYNTAVGYQALKFSEAYGGVAIGYHAATSNTNGCSIVAVGENALYGNTTGNSNVGIGPNSLTSNTEISKNTALGWNSLSNQNFAGGSSMDGYNVAIGGGALGFNNPTNTTNGIHNTALGGLAGLWNKTGYNLTLLGFQADICPSCSSVTLQNSTAVGANAIIRNSNNLILGGNTISNGNNDVNVGIGLSNDVAGPQSKLEINANPTSTTYSSAGTYGSGLQFRQMHSGTTLTTANYLAPYGRVLTTDANGVVKFTENIGFMACGNYTTLTSNIGMDLDRRNIFFKGQQQTTSANDMTAAIGIGYICGDKLPAKLSVDQTFTSSSVDAQSISGYFHNGDVTSTKSLNFEKIGLRGVCDGYSAAEEDEGPGVTNLGGDFAAQNAERTNYGVRGRTGIYTLGSGTYGNFAFGGYFLAQKSKIQNIGVFGYSDGSGGSLNYGVYGSVPTSSCASGGPCITAAGFFNGDVFCTTGNYFPSDQSLKENIQPLSNSLEIINALNPKSYNYRNSQFPNMNLPQGTQDGLLAQDVQALLPHLVRNFKMPAVPDSTGNIDTTGTSESYLAINYAGIIPYLIGAIQQQQSNLDSLNSKLEDLQNQLNGCCSSVGSQRRASSVTISDEQTIILNQNSPNPFSEETYITFNIPSTVSKALIVIYNKSGNVIQSVVIDERGEGSLHVFAEKLSSGIYMYSLVADGVTIDTKQMVCAK